MNRYKGVLQKKKSLSANTGYCPFVFKHFSLSSQSYTVLCVEMLSLSRPKGTGNPQQFFKSLPKAVKSLAWAVKPHWAHSGVVEMIGDHIKPHYLRKWQRGFSRSIHTYTFDCITNEVKPLFCNQWAMNSIATKKYRRFKKTYNNNKENKRSTLKW